MNFFIRNVNSTNELTFSDFPKFFRTLQWFHHALTFCHAAHYHNATFPMLPISSLALIPIALKTLAMVEKVKFLPFSIREI